MVNGHTLEFPVNPWGVLVPAIILGALAASTDALADAISRAHSGGNRDECNPLGSLRWWNSRATCDTAHAFVRSIAQEVLVLSRRHTVEAVRVDDVSGNSRHEYRLLADLPHIEKLAVADKFKRSDA